LLAKVNAQYDYTGIPSIEASYIMSLYTVSCSKTFKFFGITLEVSATIHIGAIGAGAKMDFKTGEFEIIPPMFGVVPDFSFDFD